MHSSEDPMKSLIEIGSKGFFPLFYPEWIKPHLFNKSRKLNLTKKDQVKLRFIMQKLAQHKNIERKRTVLHALSENDRNLFIHSFLAMVESKILEKEQSFH